MGTNNKNWEIITAIGALIAAIVAIVAVVVSCLAYYQADKANQLSNEANQQAHKINLPIVTAISNWISDENIVLQGERITISNGGQALTEFNCVPYVLIDIINTSHNNIEIEFLPINGYITLHGDEFTGNSQGILFSTFIQSSLISKFFEIQSNFSNAVTTDNRSSIRVNIEIFFSIQYVDLFGTSYNKYLNITLFGSQEIKSDDAIKMIENFITNSKSAQEYGLTLDVYHLNGKELWNWYKKEFLNK